LYLSKSTFGTQPPGAILIFLPGWDDISKTHDLLAKSDIASSLLLYPLHGAMPTAQQRGIFDRPPAGSGKRKVVIATNIGKRKVVIATNIGKREVRCAARAVAQFVVHFSSMTTFVPFHWISLNISRTECHAT
jgi:hypothetical protein